MSKKSRQKKRQDHRRDKVARLSPTFMTEQFSLPKLCTEDSGLLFSAFVQNTSGGLIAWGAQQMAPIRGSTNVVGQVFGPGWSRVSMSTSTPSPAESEHGISWFSFPCDLGFYARDLECIGFEIHHDLRRDEEARHEAYLRLRRRIGRIRTRAYKTKRPKRDTNKQNVSQSREAPRRVGRSHRRF